MCFLLYAGTRQPIPRLSWKKESPDVYVPPLIDYDAQVKAHFTLPEVQQIGSTSGCGCDFPHVMYQNGGWPNPEGDLSDEEQVASDRYNREALVRLLRATQEETVELYGVWAGDFAEEPENREEISLERILACDFYFKERGFYLVRL